MDAPVRGTPITISRRNATIQRSRPFSGGSGCLLVELRRSRLRFLLSIVGQIHASLPRATVLIFIRIFGSSIFLGVGATRTDDVSS